MFAATQFDINTHFDIFAEISNALYVKNGSQVVPQYGEVGPFEMPSENSDADKYTIIIDRVNLYDATDIYNHLKHLGLIHDITLIENEDIQTGYIYQSAIIDFNYMYDTAEELCKQMDTGASIKMILNDENDDDMNSWVIYKSII